MNDIVPAKDLLTGLFGKKLLADKAYDVNSLIDFAQSQRLEAVIPPKVNRLEQREYDKHTYKERHLVECFFAKLKVYRRISTRFEKLSVVFKATVSIASCLIWLQ